MRYTPAVLLSTLAVGHVAAANVRHASFHARRQAEAKRSANYDAVDWSKVSYDLGDVDWSTVNYGGNQPPTTPSAAPPQPEPEQPENTPAPTPTPTPEQEEDDEEKEEEPAPTSEPAREHTQSYDNNDNNDNKDDSDSDSDSHDLGDFVDDLLDGVGSMLKKLNVPTGLNAKANNGGIWIGSDSEWKAEFSNTGDKDMTLVCWQANGFDGMFIAKSQAAITVGLKPGKKVDVSFAADVPSVCAPLFSGDSLNDWGQIGNTWWEVTFGATGAFDVSRNVNMNGCNITAQGSKCTSDMDTCVYKCKNGMDSCEDGSDYDLFNCEAHNGGGGGFDKIMQGTGGGCAMGSDGEKVHVSIA